MDPLSSFGKVRTMEEDLAAAQKKPRLPEVSHTQKNEQDIAAEVIKATIVPINQARPGNEAPARPPVPPRPSGLSAKAPTAAETLPKVPFQGMPAPKPAVPPVPKRELPPPLPSRPPVPTPPLVPRAPAAPPFLPKAEKPLTPKAPSAPAPITPEKILDTLPPRPAIPLPIKPAMPSAPMEREEIKPILPPAAAIPIRPKIKISESMPPAPRRQDLLHFLPVEEEERTKPPAPSAAAPKVPAPPSAPLVGQPKKMTPEEILGVTPSAPLPITPRAMETFPAAPGKPGQPTFPTPPPPSAYQPSYEEKRGLPFPLIAGVLILVLVLGGFFAFRATRTSTPRQQPPSNVAVNPPTPFFAPDSTNIVTMQQGRESFLVEQIRALENTPGNPKSITYVPVKKSSDNTFLGTKDFFSAVGISLPNELLGDIDNQFMLYLYTPGAEEQARCAADNVTDTSCFSPRLGLVLKIKPGQETAVQNIMGGLEPTLINSFKPLILGAPAFDKATAWDTAKFNGISTYKSGVDVRFTNLPISTASLNWAETESYLVVATSKNSSYAVLDKFIPPATPAERDMKRVVDIQQAQIALEIYYAKNGKYLPATASKTCEDFSKHLNGTVGYTFSDPSGGSYKYAVDNIANPQSYVVGATLEGSLQSSGITSHKSGVVLGCDCNGSAYCVQP